MCAECDAFSWGQWLYDWQTLLSGLLALIAALIAAGFLIWQTRIMKAQLRADSMRHDEARRAKQRSARVALPDALADVSRYVRACAWSLFQRNTDEVVAPVTAIATLKSATEFLDDGPAGAVAAIVLHYQVQHSRHSLPEMPKFDRMYDCVRLGYLTDRVFEYARGDVADLSSPPDRDCEGMLKILRGLRTEVWPMSEGDDLHEKVSQKIRRLHAPDYQPPNLRAGSRAGDHL